MTTYRSFAIFSTLPGIPYVHQSRVTKPLSRILDAVKTCWLKSHKNMSISEMEGSTKSCRSSSSAVLAAFALSGRLSESFPYCYSSVAFLIRTSKLLATSFQKVLVPAPITASNCELTF
jgi:hypothetical protein